MIPNVKYQWLLNTNICLTVYQRYHGNEKYQNSMCLTKKCTDRKEKIKKARVNSGDTEG